MMQLGLFTEETRLIKLTKLGDSLEKLNIIDWEIFRPILNAVLRKERKGSGGRPAYDYILQFKILIWQRLFNLSDDQTEYQINDRMSFMRFLGLSPLLCRCFFYVFIHCTKRQTPVRTPRTLPSRKCVLPSTHMTTILLLSKVGDKLDGKFIIYKVPQESLITPLCAVYNVII